MAATYERLCVVISPSVGTVISPKIEVSLAAPLDSSHVGEVCVVADVAQHGIKGGDDEVAGAKGDVVKDKDDEVAGVGGDVVAG